MTVVAALWPGTKGNFCGSRASSRWVGGCGMPLVEALRPEAKGQLLQLRG